MNAITVIHDESQRLAAVLAEADQNAKVPTCPAWNAGDLLWHLTGVQLFWAGILREDVRTEAGVEAMEAAKPDRPAAITALLRIREEATAALITQLERLPDDEPRWSWWSADQSVGFTRRMQTHEATMHRVDAELTTGQPITPLAPDVAAAAIDHCVDVMWGRLPEWATYQAVAQVRFEATDTGQDWSVELGRWTGTSPDSGNAFDCARAVRGTGEPATGTVRAPVQGLALWSWGRGGDVIIEGEPQTRSAIERLIKQGIQ